MTKAQELFFKAGKYAGKAETYRHMRSNTVPINPKWNEYNEASERFLKLAEEEADKEYEEAYREGQSD